RPKLSLPPDRHRVSAALHSCYKPLTMERIAQQELSLPDLSYIEANADKIVGEIGRDSVEVHCFLSNEFARGSILENYVFQFTYRSFYRLDNAGLTPEFKQKYFVLLEEARNLPEVDLPDLTRRLSRIPNRKGQDSLQFSFVSKLANTVNAQYPIYD